MNASARLGLLGGTFDPVHFGHLDAADAARAALHLDEVRLIPSCDPPHRPIDPRASAFHRFALVALAVQGDASSRASDMELTRTGPSYSADTLRALHAEGWRPSQLFFILGTDAFAGIASWHGYPRVLDLAHFVVIARPGVAIDEADTRVPELRSRTSSPPQGDESLEGPTRIFLVHAHTRDVSSTMIRERLASGLPIDDLVPPRVARHIQRHHLYGAVDNLHGEDKRI
jgi:nicotinate-nucleotide adenylyltransferase